MTCEPHPTVLLADDEPLSRRAIQKALGTMGFNVRTAMNGREGRALIDELKDHPPGLLITDIEMPDCRGEELAQYARGQFTTVKLLFTSGRPQPALLKSIAGDDNARFLGKPFLCRDLIATIKDLGLTPVEVL